MKAGNQDPPSSAATERDFLYQRRLVSIRPFVTDDGVPGLNLRFAGDETMAVRIDVPLLDLLLQAIWRLKSSRGLERQPARDAQIERSF
ncbi:hypothetical protein [Scleromatobacter humisilvae]|uniref:Uncharacterized protein n=1 Tax=Scleromatobacter humisilvae TaxID=2897159 RepID=A0A9X1YEY0_9BURK|nr:hypothetical protein [Scleromatobacter humisilvae]MCK9684387.1 hypothetical protein [Scleromatobacter humisilvae]